MSNSFMEDIRQYPQDSLERRCKALGLYGVFGVSLLSLYAMTLEVMRFYNMYHSTIYTTITALIVFGAALVWMVLLMPYPLRYFGFTLKNWRHDLIEATWVSLVFCLIITLIKWSASHTFTAVSQLPVFDIGALYKAGMPKMMTPHQALLFAFIYSAFVPIQAFIVNSAAQSPLINFLPNKHASMMSVIVATVFFSALHISLDFVFALSVSVPGFFWALLYERQRSLLGVSVSHIIVGVWGLFILGYGHFFGVLARSTIS